MRKFDVILRYRNQILLVLLPIILLPLLVIIGDQKAGCAYVLLLMASYWILQVLPIPVTGLVPFILLPMFGIMGTVDVAQSYFKDMFVTLLGGFMVSVGLENSGAHIRIALNMLLGIGTKPALLLLGFMLITWLLSMWVSNMAVCALMLTIVDQVLDEIKKQAYTTCRDEPTDYQKGTSSLFKNDKSESDNIFLVSVNNCATNDAYKPDMEEKITHTLDELAIEIYCDTEDKIAYEDTHDEEGQTLPDTITSESDNELMQIDTNDQIESWMSNLGTCYYLAVAYASNLGGNAMLPGSTVNLRIKELLDELWQENGLESSPINFVSWMVLNIPASALTLILLWGWFSFYFLVFGSCTLIPGAKHFAKTRGDGIALYFRGELSKLGSMKYSEYMVLFYMIVLILLWFFLEPGFMPGWAEKFPDGYISMAVPSAMVAIFVMITPSELPTSKKASKSGRKPVLTLASWQTFVSRYPWGVMIMLGGGNSVAEAATKTGLSDWLAEQLGGMSVIPTEAILVILCLMASLLTEVVANVVAVNILVPVCATLAEDLGLNPLYFALPVGLSATFSFMFPMSSAVNAYVQSTNRVSMMDSIKAGSVINFLAVGVTLLATHTWGMAYFNLDELPWPTASVNTTTTSSFM